MSMKSFAALALLLPMTVLAQQPGGLMPGAKAPAFTLQDQADKPQTLQSLSGKNGLLLLFFRSADWCPFCKGQLVDLEGAQKAFAAKGINVAAVSYDSPAILADFSHRRAITYPLLSDKNSELIDTFGIRNPAGKGIEAGIPYPGYYLIDAHGVIVKRFFETAYVNRLTANNLYANLFGDVPLPTTGKRLEATPHVTVTTSQSDTSVTPGSVVRLSVELTPAPETHVYAPGAEKYQYIVTSLSFVRSDLYTAGKTSYPKPEILSVPELDQQVPVYNGRTKLDSSVAAVVDRTTLPHFSQASKLDVKAELTYQACTKAVCFPPVKVPVDWTVNLKPLDRERVAESIQHR
jgi:peroxiredoxin